MEEEKELWDLVRGNISDKREKEIVEEKIENKVKEEKVAEPEPAPVLNTILEYQGKKY